MIDLTKFSVRAYTEAAAPAVGLTLSPEQLIKVAAAFELVVKFGGPALHAPIPPDAEPAPVFHA